MRDADAVKKLLREKMDALRRERSETDRAAASKRICTFAETLCESRLAGRPDSTICVYIPFRGEVDLRPLIHWAWERGLQVAVPKTNRATRSMSMHPITGFQDLEPGNWGIAEPKSHIPPLELQTISVVFVPGLAFDLRGGRLGYGGGYYDRFFRMAAEAGVKPLAVGAAYHFQLVERVPTEAHDMRVDQIVTERGVHEAHSQESS